MWCQQREAFSSMLHESQPGQFGVKFPAEYIWWPHINRKIHNHGNSCRQSLKAGKNLKVLLGSEHASKLPDLTFTNEEINLDFAGPLDAFWGSKKKFLLCIERSTKFSSAKFVKITSPISVISFLNDYCHLHDFPRKIRFDHRSCFLSNNFISFCEKLNLETFYCTVFVKYNTVKSKLLAIS